MQEEYVQKVKLHAQKREDSFFQGLLRTDSKNLVDVIIGETPHHVYKQHQLSYRSIGLSARTLEPPKEPKIVDDRPLKIKRIKPIVAPCSLQVVS